MDFIDYAPYTERADWNFGTALPPEWVFYSNVQKGRIPFYLDALLQAGIEREVTDDAFDQWGIPLPCHSCVGVRRGLAKAAEEAIFSHMRLADCPPGGPDEYAAMRAAVMTGAPKGWDIFANAPNGTRGVYEGAAAEAGVEILVTDDAYDFRGSPEPRWIRIMIRRGSKRAPGLGGIPDPRVQRMSDIARNVRWINAAGSHKTEGE